MKTRIIFSKKCLEYGVKEYPENSTRLEKAFEILSSYGYEFTRARDVINEIGRRYNGVDFLRDFEYLAHAMFKIKLQRDPSYKVPETFAKYIPERNSSTQ